MSRRFNMTLTLSEEAFQKLDQKLFNLRIPKATYIARLIEQDVLDFPTMSTQHNPPPSEPHGLSIKNTIFSNIEKIEQEDNEVLGLVSKHRSTILDKE